MLNSVEHEESFITLGPDVVYTSVNIKKKKSIHSLNIIVPAKRLSGLNFLYTIYLYCMPFVYAIAFFKYTGNSLSSISTYQRRNCENLDAYFSDRDATHMVI